MKTIAIDGECEWANSRFPLPLEMPSIDFIIYWRERSWRPFGSTEQYCHTTGQTGIGYYSYLFNEKTCNFQSDTKDSFLHFQRRYLVSFTQKKLKFDLWVGFSLILLSVGVTTSQMEPFSKKPKILHCIAQFQWIGIGGPSAGTIHLRRCRTYIYWNPTESISQIKLLLFLNKNKKTSLKTKK